MTETLLSPDDLAERFEVTRRRVLEWNAMYQWPHTRIGRRIYWTTTQLEQILSRQSVKAGQVVNRDGRTSASRSRRRSA